MTSDTLTVLIVRHGQTEHNKKHILQGHLDTSLNETGMNEAALAGKRLREMDIALDALWSSDLVRCGQTTQQLLKYGQFDNEQRRSRSRSRSPRVSYWHELRERSMGEIEGLTVAEAHAKRQQEGKQFHDYGEPRQDAVKRLNSAFDRIVGESLEKDYNCVMIVSHGGVISKFIAHLVTDEGFVFGPAVKKEDIKVPHNTSITTVVVDKKSRKGVVETFGDASHLGTSLHQVNQYEK